MILELRHQRVSPGWITIAEGFDVRGFAALFEQAELFIDEADDPTVGPQQVGKAIEIVADGRRLTKLEPAAQIGLDQGSQEDKLVSFLVDRRGRDNSSRIARARPRRVAATPLRMRARRGPLDPARSMSEPTRGETSWSFSRFVERIMQVL